MIRTMHVGGKRRAVLPPSIGYQTATMKPTPADVCFMSVDGATRIERSSPWGD